MPSAQLGAPRRELSVSSLYPCSGLVITTRLSDAGGITTNKNRRDNHSPEREILCYAKRCQRATCETTASCELNLCCNTPGSNNAASNITAGPCLVNATI
eukprot:3042744-Pleurochrysis_carterae.AAC.3